MILGYLFDDKFYPAKYNKEVRQKINNPNPNKIIWLVRKKPAGYLTGMHGAVQNITQITTENKLEYSEHIL